MANSSFPSETASDGAATLSPTKPADRIAELEARIECYETWIRKASQVCQSAARGDLEPRLLGIDVTGELAEMLHGINHLLDLSDAFVREAGAALLCASRGDFFRRVLTTGMLGSFRRTSTIINEAAQEMERKNAAVERDLVAARRREALASEFESSLKEIVATVAHAAMALQGTAGSLRETAQRTHTKLDAVTSITEDTCADADRIAAATDELSEAVHEIGDQASASSMSAHEALETSTRSGERVTQLAEASQNIKTISQLIQGIAAQTNLLALNATVEAARAGEAGRSFAVVASEVKELAGKTDAATHDIDGQIKDIQKATNAVVEENAKIGEVISRMDEFSAKIAASIREQTEVTARINDSARNAAGATRNIVNNLTHVMQDAKETGDSAEQLFQSATDLSELGERLQSQVDAFLAEITGRSARSQGGRQIG